MKTCEELGWKVGDRFICVKEDSLSEGDIVELYKDDGSTCPRFKLVYPEDQYVYEYTSCFEPLIEENTTTPVEELENTNKYIRTIHGVEVDVYDVLNAWEVTCPATQHAIKKLLMPGQRGSKDALQDLKEAEQAIKRAIELEEG